tara:strand:- start:912 stop:2249 length:1338 start_codon:yes stop_codon:yes gene_type:complete
MSYFNHAFCKTFVATKATQTAQNAGTPGAGNKAGITDGILTSTGIGVWNLKENTVNDGYELGPGVVGFFDSKTNLSINLSANTDCCPFYVAAASIKLHDKQGPHHGGYQESNKSKVVNPKYLRKAWKVDPNAATRAVLELGGTPDNISGDAACAKDFLCEETYYLRVEAKGTAALRFANHNLYRTFGAYTGCCDDPAAPTTVDPAIVYVDWATQITEDPYLSQFIRPLVVVDGDSYGYDAAVIAEEGLTPGNDFAAALAAAGTNAGMILLGAYVDTTFEDCTFQVTDYYGKEPIQLLASEVDLNGDPCAFEGLCVTTVCEGVQANGLGESVLRDVIKSESYLQNFLHSDLRIREITQGTSSYSIIDRSTLYGRFFLLHSVPRYNNPTGVFDNDQYLLDIVGTASDTNNTLESLLEDLIENCNINCEGVEDYTVTGCDYTVPVVAP